MTSEAKTSELRFERETCGRCGGSGKYSFNLRHGSVCYGCGGSGQVLTKRGAAAVRFYRENARKRVGEIEIGEVIRTVGVTNGGDVYGQKLRVDRIDRNPKSGRIDPATGKIDAGAMTLISDLGARGLCMHGANENDLVEVVFTGEERIKRLTAAIEYQATLTKKGEPRKR